MIVAYPGHVYELKDLDGPGYTRLTFVQRPPHHPASPGTNCQEVIRALIDRVQVLDRELPWRGNEEIIHHLRAALVLFEFRAICRKMEKGKLKPEQLPVGDDGHFQIVGIDGS